MPLATFNFIHRHPYSVTKPWALLPNDERRAFEAGAIANDAMVPRDANPHEPVQGPVLYARWNDAWTTRAEEICVRSPVNR